MRQRNTPQVQATARRGSNFAFVAWFILSVSAAHAQDKTSLASSAGAAVSVAAFGAKCDGTTDDTAALRAAAAAIPSSGATLRFINGTCIVHGTIYLKSHTHVEGNGASMLASVPWKPDHAGGYAFFENEHFSATAITDTDISVNRLTFDYGHFGEVPVRGGGKHAVRFKFVRNGSVTNSTFLLRGAEDAIAGIGVDSMLVKGNAAYEFRNCAYDFWHSPTNVRVIENFAETSTSGQMVNFNPEPTRGVGDASMVARNFVLSENILKVTGPKAVPIQIEPLGPNTSVENITVSNNILDNVYLVLRGAVRGGRVEGNQIANVAGGPSAIETYPRYGQSAEEITFANNIIRNAETVPGEYAVMRIDMKRATLTNNVIIGSRTKARPLYLHDPSATQTRP